MQDVFSAVAVSLDSYEPRAVSGSFRAWLWTITRNKVRDMRRRKSRQISATGGSTAHQVLANLPAECELPDAEPTTVEQLDELVHRAAEQVCGEFEPGTWQAFWRTAIDGIPTAVVAKELGVSAAAIRQNRARVMRRLRQQLGDLR